MPSCRNFSRARFQWLFRVCALRRWWYLIFVAAFCNTSPLAFGDDNPHERTKAAIAVCNWQMVSSGFFFPPVLTHASQEQVAYRRDDEVAFQPQIATPLVLIQTDLALVVLETTFHTPARERHQQQGLQTGLYGAVADEELQFVRLQDVARHHQVESLAGQPLGVFDGDHGVLTFPYHGPLLTILDVEPLPRLIAEPLVAEQFVDPPRWRAAAGQAWYLATTSLA